MIVTVKLQLSDPGAPSELVGRVQVTVVIPTENTVPSFGTQSTAGQLLGKSTIAPHSPGSFALTMSGGQFNAHGGGAAPAGRSIAATISDKKSL
jgi:hypothetical protein